MKAPITVLLAAAFLLHSARPERIQCYFCYDPTPVQYCNEVKTCAPNITHCKTITESSNTGYPFVTGDLLVTRDCSRLCASTDMDALGTEEQIFCCEGDLCNQRYEEVTGNYRNSSAPHLHSATYGPVMVGVGLFSILLPSWL